MEYSGENKRAGNVREGDFVSVTGYGADAAQVEDVRPVSGLAVLIRTCNGRTAIFPSDKLLRLYQETLG